MPKEDLEINLNTDWVYTFKSVNASGYTQGRLQIKTLNDDGTLISEPYITVDGSSAIATLSRLQTIETELFKTGTYFYDLLLQDDEGLRVKRVEGKVFIRPTVTTWTDTPPIPPVPAPVDQVAQRKTAFSWGDATPRPIITVSAGKTVFTAQIVITVPFDGVGAALQLGDAGNAGRLIASNAIAPSMVAEWESNPGYTYSADTQILLTITPGAGASQGSGFVILEV